MTLQRGPDGGVVEGVVEVVAMVAAGAVGGGG